MDSKPKRRWYQFSLRTMLVAMVVASASFGWWVHWSKEWIRQRREWRMSHYGNYEHDEVITQKTVPQPVRPLALRGLWLFGEQGMTAIACYDEQAEAARQLFPEATVYTYPSEPISFAPVQLSPAEGSSAS